MTKDRHDTEMRLLLDDVVKALDRLDKADREVLELTYFAALSVPQIAFKLGIAEPEAARLLARGLLRFQLVFQTLE